MKKLFLTTASAVALLAAGPALAQNVSDVEQTGNTEYAEVMQNGVGSNNSDVDQGGANNKAYVTQTSTAGDVNKSVLRQTDNSSGNKATVEQTGEGNFSDVLQD